MDKHIPIQERNKEGKLAEVEPSAEVTNDEAKEMLNAFNDLVIDGDFAANMDELGLDGDEDGAKADGNEWAAFLGDQDEERDGSPEDMADVGPVGANPLRDEVDALAAQVT